MLVVFSPSLSAFYFLTSYFIFTIQLTLFDTAGMERFSYTIPPTYFRNTKVVLLVYSTDDIDTASNLMDWVTNFHQTRIGDNSSAMLRVLVGNKSDLSMAETTRDIAREIANNCDVPDDMRFEISAKDGDGFDELFNTIAKRLSQHQQPSSTQTIKVKKDSDGKKRPIICCK